MMTLTDPCYHAKIEEIRALRIFGTYTPGGVLSG